MARWLGVSFLRKAAFLAPLVLLPAAACADPVAVIAAVRGKVQVLAARDRTTQRAAFGQPLERGDRVTVGPGAAATVFFSDGNVIELAEKSTVTVSGRITTRSPAGPAAQLPGDVYAQVSRFVTRGSRETGLVALSAMRGEALALLLAPRNTDVLDGRPSFAWRAVEGATRYHVTLSDERGQRWAHDVTGASLAYPEDAPALAPDADYLWEVEAWSASERLRRESAPFRVIAAERAGAVRANLDRIRESAGGEASAAGHFLAGSYLFGCGLYRDAADHFETLCRLSPDSPAPHEALGNIYRAVGLMDQAAAEFERALALSRPR